MSGFEIELPSSPDPLGDESIVVPPASVARPPPSTTRRPFQSSVSSRFSAIPGTSPRKRMFALDVGNEITPQTIYVTVEAGPDGNPVTKPGGGGVGGANVRRLLFGSPTPQPSPRRGARTTTTTIPLRGLTDDEGDQTPRRRRRSSGRPGTPATAGAKRKKKGTPTPKATRKPRDTPVASSDAVQPEPPATLEKSTPGTGRKRGRPRKRKADTAPSDQDKQGPPEASATKQGRKRQKSIQADDTDELTAAGIDFEPQSHDRHPSQHTDITQDLLPEEAPGDAVAAYEDEGDEEDPFLAQLSDPNHDEHHSSMAGPATELSEPAYEDEFERQNPRLEDQGPLPGESDDYAPMMDFDDRSDVGSQHSLPPSLTAQVGHGTLELEDQGPLPGESDDFAPMMDRDDGSDVQSHHSEITPRASRHVAHDPPELEDQGPLPGESDDYAPMMDLDDRSDVESNRSFRPARSEDATDNTVDPDTFTMIGIETMPSFQGNRGAPTSDLPEIGETTSLLINKTLESLRQEIDMTDEENDEIDLLGSREQTPAEAMQRRPQDISSGKKQSPAQKRSQVPQSRAKQSPENASQPARASVPREFAAPEAVQKNRQFPAQPIRVQGDNSITGLSSDELNADEDSFSDIPEEVFAAVEPQEVPHSARSPSEDELDTAVGVTRNLAPDAGYSHEIMPVDLRKSEHLDSDRSESARLPSDHLERSETDNVDLLQRSASQSAQSGRRSSQATQKSSPPHPTRSRSDSNRLLTPPDEPTSSSDQSIPATNQPHEEPNVFIDPDGQIGSSPPEITTFDQEDEQPTESSRRSSDTPANRPPSIHLQPVQAREANAATFPSQPAGPRPFLSPIVRVGERLQNILSDPPSPSARSSVLGSPFKGSVRKSSLDGPSDEEIVHKDTSSNTTLQNPPAQAESPKASWAQSLFSLSHLKSLVTERAQKIASPQTNAAQTWEDPFGPSSPTKDRSGKARNSAFMDRIRQASREGSVHSSRTSIARATIGDMDDRSFSGDPAPRGLSSNWKGDSSQKPGLSGSNIFPGRQLARLSNGCDGTADEEPEAMGADRLPQEPRTDDTLLQPLEDQALETEVVQYPLLQDEAVQEEENQTRPEDDAMQLDEAPLDGDGSDDEDVWAIEADRTASSPTAQKRANESINESFNAFARSGLSIDWGTRSTISQTLPPGRSPAFKQSVRSVPQDVPENLEDYSLLDLHSGTSTQPSAKKPTPEAQQQPKRVDLSDFFSSSPNFIERERRAKTALRARSDTQNPDEGQAARITSPRRIHDVQHAQLSPQGQLSSDSRLSDELPSPARRGGQHFGQGATGQWSSTPTPERPRLPQQRAAPRPAQNDAALFENWEVSSSRAPTERLYLTDPISDAQPSSPQVIERPSTPEDPGESSYEGPTLKPLPGPTVSPSKSCLRSPLKPKTPGRVVEFTSSTLSPMAQGQARAEAQSKNTINLAHPTSLSLRRSPRGKENKPSALKSYIRSSPHHKHVDFTQQQGQEQAVDSPLSQTKWSKRHWLLMDELLQAHRRNALDFQLRHSDAVMASPKKRASSSLLGKMVTSQGERMALEQWHLDIVDAFKKEVGGWPEDALAKRLFSLIVGEERRRDGLVPKRR